MNPPIDKDMLLQAKDRLAEIHTEAKALREEELAIRTYLADALHPAEEGSKTIKIDDKLKLTITRSLNRSINRTDAEALSQELPTVAVEVLRWEPKVSVSAFKKLAEAHNLHRFITTKPGPPTVEFKS